ncbi:MAG: GDSL-type esterase/lipase family protein [Acidobacteria bacterium]|nr:GDSL-type esterase/lipase family protein [Acidobacteriota bacterium]
MPVPARGCLGNRIRFWLLYLSAVSVAILIALECAVRLLGVAPPLLGYRNVTDPYLPFRPRPNFVSRAVTKEYECEYRNNSLGFRDVEHAREKPEGVFRILVLGDSFTYGTGVAFEETYARRLESMLNGRAGRHSTVEVINAGVYRYFPEAERILLERYGVNYSPDLVVVGFLPNDVLDTHLGLDAIKINESGQLVTRGAVGSGRLKTFLYSRSHAFRIAYNRFAATRFGGGRNLPLEEVYNPEGIFKHDWETVEAEYRKMVSVADKAGARVVVAHIPHKGPWEERHSYPAVRLGEWSARGGFVFVDIMPAMKEASRDKSLYYPFDGHCRPAGHEVIAETLFKALERERLVP